MLATMNKLYTIQLEIFGGWVPIAISNVFVDLNSDSVQMYIASKKFWWTFNLAVAKAVRQTAKLNSLPNFPAIQIM